MSVMDTDLLSHLQTGATTVCHVWIVTRRDGTAHGFTDHDRDLEIEGVMCKADTGVSATMLHQSSGLSIDNSEAAGALKDGSITEEDILAGRYDGADVVSWLVNWETPEQRHVLFRGALGEITRGGGAFQAELRGLTERLNQPQGRVYHPACPHVLGDGGCGLNLDTPIFTGVGTIVSHENALNFVIAGGAGYDPGWFERGRFEVITGPAAGLQGVIKVDAKTDTGRDVALWDRIRILPNLGDQVKLIAGCDKRQATCKDKFSNFLNFGGFPHIPGEDWLMAVPKQGGNNNGGSL
ncbi:MAG: DUF2163 domain-containing protein [Halocynthiibacter sp.]